MRLTELKRSDLGENNNYYHIREDGSRTAFGAQMYAGSLWRLVMTREHGEPVFEKVDDILGRNNGDMISHAEDAIAELDGEQLEFSEEEFLAFTGTSLGTVVYDGE